MIKGHCYRPGCVLALDYVDFWPSYGVVDRILVIDYQKFFILTKLDVIEFDNHIGSYIVRRSEVIVCLFVCLVLNDASTLVGH